MGISPREYRDKYCWMWYFIRILCNNW
jgi:hypothetical protein